MAYTTINKQTDYFNTKLYTGNGSTNAITGVGFQPDFTWIKKRDGGATQHQAFDSVRGVTKRIFPDSTEEESTSAITLTAFGTDGFTVGSNTGVNDNSQNHVAWNWKAGTTGSGNTGGSGTYKTYNYSANTTAGFSIIKYTGNGTSGHTIPHHLGAVPSMVIVKRLENTRAWCVGHTSQGWTKAGFLSGEDGFDAAYDYWNNATPTSTSIALSNSVAVNSNDETYIMYIFTEKTGYSKFGTYTGNGNADGTFVYTGFKPAFILIKCASSGNTNWQMYDNKREGYNPQNDLFRANLNSEEGNGTDPIDIYSNGFKNRHTASSQNTNGGTYIYMTFGQSLVGSNNIPCTAR